MTNTKHDWFGDFKAKLSIVDVVARYVRLEQKGKNFWGCCPFHNEKTPSFTVSEERQSYKCFGCGASGDAIHFVQEMESLDFMSAVRVLAKQIGYEIPELHYDEAIVALRKKKQRYQEMMKHAARFYHELLLDQSGAMFLEYIRGRDISNATIKTFGLGAAPKDSRLVQHLTELGYLGKEMTETGLCYEKNGKLFDCMERRLVFPIIDLFGNVIAFGGRLLEKTDFAKYKNTAQTILFDKSKTLYGIHSLKKQKALTSQDGIVVVEGYMDVLALYQAGFCNVVASMGTSLTKEQAQQLKRLSDKVYISYDGDSAGQRATLRGLDILKQQDIDVYVVSLPDNLDPDDIIRNRGNDAYLNCLQQALNLNDYKFQLLNRYFNLEVPEQKRKYIAKALQLVATFQTAIEQEDYLSVLKKNTGVSFEALKQDLARMRAGEQDGQKLAQSEDSKQVTETGEDKSMRYLLYCYFTDKPFVQDVAQYLAYFTRSSQRMLFERAETQKKKQQKFDKEQLLERCTEEEKEELLKIYEYEKTTNNERDAAAYYADCWKILQSKSCEEQIDMLSKQLEQEQDETQKKELAKMITKLTQQLLQNSMRR